MAEFQRKGSTFQQVSPRSSPSRGPLSRSPRFPLLHASLWEVSQQHSSPGCEENSLSFRETNPVGSPGQRHCPQMQSHCKVPCICVLKRMQETRVLYWHSGMDTVCHVNLKERLINNIRALKPASFASSVPNA